ncbi:hypothetical protein QUA00_05745 [Microcoleus sp. T2B6]|uniref:hypothetical protein n=1 Tax=Microcoleus sp. T2B6 TaxID=3055424 RepID=UPI002FD2C121
MLPIFTPVSLGEYWFVRFFLSCSNARSTRQSKNLQHLLHYCIRRGYFLMRRVKNWQVRRGRSHSGLLICLVKDTSAAFEVK